MKVLYLTLQFNHSAFIFKYMANILQFIWGVSGSLRCYGL